MCVTASLPRLPAPTAFRTASPFAGMDHLPPAPPTPLPEVSRIVRITRVGNAISVKALTQQYLSRTPNGSKSIFSLREFGWQEFRLLEGADTALQLLPEKLHDRIKALLEWKIEAGDVELGDEILFGPREESNLAFAAIRAIAPNGVWFEIPV